jgi:flagellar biosynthetic protein FliP
MRLLNACVLAALVTCGALAPAVPGWAQMAVTADGVVQASTPAAPAPASAMPATPAPAGPAASAPASAPAAPPMRARLRATAPEPKVLNAVGKPVQTAEVVRTALVLTIAALIPAIVICMTPFVRIIVVLSMIRHAFGMPETPPNQVLVSLALFLTAFTMMPTLGAVNDQAFQPFMQGQISVESAMTRGAEPMRVFMLRQVHDRDLAAVYQISKKSLPDSAAQVGTIELTSAFMLNELRVAFKIGFVVLLPFLLIDLVVSAVLLSLGMLMVPPSTISLPIKVLMFVLIDGWSLVLENVVGSFK